MIKSHEKVCKNENILEIVFPSSKNNILEFNQYKKLDKMLYIIYTNIESLIKKIERKICKQSRKDLNNKSRKAYSWRIFNANYLGI